MFFCTRDLSDGRPIGINCKGREPLAYKVENQEIFRQAINDLFQMIDEGKFSFDPISWNLYRKLNNLPLVFNWFGSDIFDKKGDYVVIDDYTTDIDYQEDIEKIEKLIKIMKGEIEMYKVEVIENFNLGRFNELQNIIRKDNKNDIYGRLYVGDIFECDKEMAKYLKETNSETKKHKRPYVKVIEKSLEKEIKVDKELVQAVATAIVEEAEEQDKEVNEVVEEIIEEATEPKKKTTKKSTTKKTTTRKKKEE